MTASDGPPRDPIDPQPHDQSERYDDPFWTHQRRAVFRDAVRRVVTAAVLGLLAFAWAVFATLLLLDRACRAEPELSCLAWFAWLLPGIVLFALSVARLVGRCAAPMLRIMGVIYAILGTVFVLYILTETL